ncbi:MAG: exosortase/archaeosortase family protein [Candidatus Azobacteroides sp.]|nr:exosortase/archaeosortase family protein [Candidatus Azobacteroides sp.]
MNEKFKPLLLFLKPYIGFLFLLFFFHFAWKIAIDGDMDSEYIYLFGKDITPSWFGASCRGLTQAAAWFIHLFPNTQDLLVEATRLKFDTKDNIWIGIIWGCLGFKQMSIYAGIILFYWGPLLKKLWYIPLGCFILTGYNVIRIATIVWLTNGHPQRFESLHDGILRYIYYTIVFILWVVWNELIVRNNYTYAIRSNKNSKSAENHAD